MISNAQRSDPTFALLYHSRLEPKAISVAYLCSYPKLRFTGNNDIDWGFVNTDILWKTLLRALSNFVLSLLDMINSLEITRYPSLWHVLSSGCRCESETVPNKVLAIFLFSTA
jgi:hypothetical protein